MPAAASTPQENVNYVHLTLAELQRIKGDKKLTIKSLQGSDTCVIWRVFNIRERPQTGVQLSFSCHDENGALYDGVVTRTRTAFVRWSAPC